VYFPYSIHHKHLILLQAPCFQTAETVSKHGSPQTILKLPMSYCNKKPCEPIALARFSERRQTTPYDHHCSTAVQTNLGIPENLKKP
ncbi:MAG: hypothetical protein KDD60_09815, partial [Bdellovibrionales bacterium]|nr:hypothetical protein [Bdellovibrionales bacterium]